MEGNKQLQWIRELLAHISGVIEKKMFGGITFMVKGKMCISVGRDKIMCRISPEAHKQAVQRRGCSTVVMKGRAYLGFVHINFENLKTKKEIEHWLTMCLEFNTKAKATKNRKK